MKVARFKPWKCVKCGAVMSAATDSSGDELPGEGDYSCCLTCAEPYVLESHKWRHVTDDELIAMSLEQKQAISRVQLLIRQFNKENPRR